MIKKINLILISIIFISFATAGIPEIPHQFYGNVYINNSLAISGTVIAKINNITFETGEIVNGKYGYEDLFFIEDIEDELTNDLISFYINDIFVTIYQFENGGITKLDLNCTECPIIPPTIPVNDTNQTNEDLDEKKYSNGNHFVQFCDVNWKCSGWSKCVNGISRRICEETNNCEYSYNQPTEIRNCEDEITEKSLIKENYSILVLILIFTTLIILAGILIIIEKNI